MLQIGISGMGIISAAGKNTEETKIGLFAEHPTLPAQSRRVHSSLHLPVFELDTPKLPDDFFGGYPLWFLFNALEEALHNAHLSLKDLQTFRVGAVVGTTVACQLDNVPFYDKLRKNNADDLSPVLKYILGMPAEWIHRKYQLNGPAITVSNACASGSDAVMIGADWLKQNKCDIVIAAGCDAVNKTALNGFHALRVFSNEPCRPFDASRKGLNLGDGAGVLILETPQHASERGIVQKFEIAGAGKTADAFHITQPDSEGTELQNAVLNALKEAELSPQQIDFINAHGTGTLVNDKVETNVFSRVFPSGFRFHSTKSITGHTLGAAGTIELIFCILMLEKREMVKSHRFIKADEETAAMPVQRNQSIPGFAALSTSLAFGGSNTAIVVKQTANGEHADLRDPVNIFVSAFCRLNPGEPDSAEITAVCKKYRMRRLDKLTQYALYACHQIASGLQNNDGVTGLITVTSYGPSNANNKLVCDILDYSEDEILPINFSHSVINAAASYIESAFQIHGPAFSVTGFSDPFYEAVSLAQSMLYNKRCVRVLIAVSEEHSNTVDAGEKMRLSIAPKQTEGGFSLLLSSKDEENVFGRLILSEDVSEERLFPCGVPLRFTDELTRSGKDSIVSLPRCGEPVWAE